jgi:hypothetical protein
MVSARQPFAQRKIRLIGPEQVERAVAAIRNAPVDHIKPLEFLIREEVKVRKLSQNALMWAGPMKDIAEQVWVEGRQYSDEVWHQHFKQLFLPEEYYPELCRSEDYRKWEFGPGGDPVIVGSTTDLTIKGFAQYLDQIHAFGANHGVEFHEPPQRG